jgi:NADPH-dependent 2,4-dienoyl-CoA reductase/sulfur reductase-like enzyme
MTERLVVIGGDAAGLAAASQARKRRAADDLEIVAFEKGEYASYSACGIPYLIAGDVAGPDRLIAREPTVFRDKQAIDLRMRSEVTAIDVNVSTVTVHDWTTGKDYGQPYDQLVIATGAIAARPPLPGADAAGVHGIQTLTDAMDLERRLGEEKPERAVVVGAGYIGLEMAEALIRRGLTVALVDGGPQPMRTLDPDMGALVADALRGIGVTLHQGERVTAFCTAKNGHIEAVQTGTGTIRAELVVLGMGNRPNSALAAAAGIPVGSTGGIRTDRQMRTGVDGVWAAGDAVETFHLVSGRPVAIALGTHANKQGRVAGINLGGGYATFPGVLGTAVSKICGYQIARTGLTEAEAADAGFATESVVVESTSRAGYFPGATSMKTKLIAERRTGRLLGAQIVGKEGAAKRIDGLAIALWNRMTVEDMSGLDLSYAPPFSPVWDPVLIAARKAAELIERLGESDGRRDRERDLAQPDQEAGGGLAGRR